MKSPVIGFNYEHSKLNSSVFYLRTLSSEKTKKHYDKKCLEILSAFMLMILAFTRRNKKALKFANTLLYQWHTQSKNTLIGIKIGGGIMFFAHDA